MEANSAASLRRHHLFEGLCEAAAAKKLGHAILLHSTSEASPSFVEFLQSFTQFLLCQQPSGIKFCGKCDSCKLLQSGAQQMSHPDAFLLEPEGVKGYSVERTRDLISSFYLKHSLSNNRVCWIKSADLLSSSGAQSANSLLKLIEEPRPNSFILLTTENVGVVLPTIKSRCHVFRVPSLSDEALVNEDGETLVAWLRGGGSLPPLGPDNESYFEHKELAIKELTELNRYLWAAIKFDLPSFSREKAYFTLDFLKAVETFALSLKFYANVGMGWSNLRIQFGKCPSS